MNQLALAGCISSGEINKVDVIEDGQVTRREDRRHLVESKRKYGMGESRKQIERKRRGDFMRSIVG